MELRPFTTFQLLKLSTSEARKSRYLLTKQISEPMTPDQRTNDQMTNSETNLINRRTNERRATKQTENDNQQTSKWTTNNETTQWTHEPQSTRNNWTTNNDTNSELRTANKQANDR